MKLQWSPSWGCWPQNGRCRASLWHLSTVGNTEQKGGNNSVVDALVSLGPVSGEFRGPKQFPAPDKAHDKASLLLQMFQPLAILH